MENTNAYAYKVYNSCTEDKFCSFISFLFLTDDKSKCEEYIKRYIDEEVKKDLHDDNGNLVNWWWKFTKVEETTEITDGVYTVIIL